MHEGYERIISVRDPSKRGREEEMNEIPGSEAFFQTGWGYVLCGLVLLGLAFLGYRLRVRRLKAITRKLREVVDRRTGELRRRSWDLQQRNREWGTLEQAVRDINREMKLEPLLQVLLHAALELFPQARSGIFFIYDEPTRQYIPRVYEGFESHPGEETPFFTGEDLEGLKRGARELDEDIYFCSALSAIEGLSGLPALRSFHSLLAVAGTVDEHPQGLLLLGTDDAPMSIESWDIHKLIIFREHAVYALARSRIMQNLATTVEDRTVELSKSNELLEKKLEELLRAQEELTAARQTAEQADMVKTRFLTNISHEIRTPMNAIIGFTELLDAELADKRHKGFLKAIAAGGQTLMALIDDILDLAKIEAGNVHLHYEPVNPVCILGEIKHLFQREAEAKELTLRVLTGKHLPELVMLDHARVRQILFNLVGNAVKFTHEGSVTISADIRDGGIAPVPGDSPGSVDIVFSVRDTGAGIPEEQQEIIFQIFRQQDGLQYEAHGGTGLGLGISRRLTELMDGSITVESRVNKGSTFSVILPDIRVAGPVRESSLSDVPSLKAPREINAVVLVADDVEMNRSVLVECLNSYGIDAIEAEDGVQVLQLAERHMPDLILMDVRMPLLNGLEAARALEDDPKLKDIPVVILTAYSAGEEEWIKNRGIVDDFLKKPVTRKQILEKIAKFIPGLAGNQKNGPAGFRTAEEKRKLLETLRSHTMKAWEEVNQTFILKDINSFAQKVLKLAQSSRSHILEDWARKLAAQVGNFDMQKVALTLERFPGIISEIEAQPVKEDREKE